MKGLEEGFLSTTVPNAGKRLLETDVMFPTSLLDLLLNSKDNGDLSSDVPNAVEDLPLLNNNGTGDLASEVVMDILSLLLLIPLSRLVLPLTLSYHLYYCFLCYFLDYTTLQEGGERVALTLYTFVLPNNVWEHNFCNQLILLNLKHYNITI